MQALLIIFYLDPHYQRQPRSFKRPEAQMRLSQHRNVATTRPLIGHRPWERAIGSAARTLAVCGRRRQEAETQLEGGPSIRPVEVCLVVRPKRRLGHGAHLPIVHRLLQPIDDDESRPQGQHLCAMEKPAVR